MKNTLEDKFKSAKEELSLTEKERERMWSLLESYREIHPTRLQATGTSRPKRASRFFAISYVRVVPALVLVVVLFGSGVMVAAERSLPGQALYSIKTSTEEIRSALSSDEAGARYEAQRASRRLAEAEQLAERGELSERAAEGIRAEFETSARDLQGRLQELQLQQEQTVLDIGSEFQSKTRIYSQILGTLAEENEGLGDLVKTLAEHRDDEFDKQLSTRIGVETETGTEGSVEPTEDETSEEETSTEIGITEVDTQVSEEESTEQTPDTMSEEEDEGDTSEASQETASDSDIDPARIDMIRGLVEEKITRSQKLIEKTSRISDSELLEVLQQELDHVRSLVTEGEKAREEDGLEEAEQTLKRGLARAQDVITVLEVAKTAKQPSALVTLFERESNTGESPDPAEKRDSEGENIEVNEEEGSGNEAPSEGDSTEDTENTSEETEEENLEATEEEGAAGDGGGTDEESNDTSPDAAVE